MEIGGVSYRYVAKNREGRVIAYAHSDSTLKRLVVQKGYRLLESFAFTWLVEPVED